MDWIGVVTAAVIGACVGSFAAVLLDRVPRGESVVSPRSRCSSCHHPLGGADLIPVLSFVLLRGRCRWCKAAIPLQALVMEVGTALLGMVAFMLLGWFGVGAALGMAAGASWAVAQSKRSGASEAGYTMIEAVLAMALLAFVITSYAGVFARNTRIEAVARTRLTMVNMVREQLDLLQAQVAAGTVTVPQTDWSPWACANGADLEARYKVVTWNGSSSLWHAIAEVRNNPCGATPSPTVPPRVERGWAILRHD